MIKNGYWMLRKAGPPTFALHSLVFGCFDAPYC